MELKFKRNSSGLLDGIDYKFREDGTIDWRAMVDPKFLVINKDSEADLVKKFEKPISEIPVTEIEDSNLLILLQGIKNLARLRGYTRLESRVDFANDNKAAVVTTITWLPNFETEGHAITFSGVGSASLESTSGFGQLYLESIAENRAFVRAVRNFLGIAIVGKDEIDEIASKKVIEKEQEAAVNPHGPHAVLTKMLENMGLNFEQFKAKIAQAVEAESSGFNPNEWNVLSDIKPKDVYKLIDILKKS